MEDLAFESDLYGSGSLYGCKVQDAIWSTVEKIQKYVIRRCFRENRKSLSVQQKNHPHPKNEILEKVELADLECHKSEFKQSSENSTIMQFDPLTKSDFERGIRWITERQYADYLLFFEKLKFLFDLLDCCRSFPENLLESVHKRWKLTTQCVLRFGNGLLPHCSRRVH